MRTSLSLGGVMSLAFNRIGEADRSDASVENP
jgi:hypothetical protein